MPLRPGLSCCVLAALLGTASAKSVQVGILQDGPSPQLDRIAASLKKEILELTRGQAEVEFPETMSLHADWTVPGVQRAVRTLLQDRDVDVVLGLGFICSAELARQKSLPKPTLALYVVDAALQGFPVKAGTSGLKNFGYLAREGVVERDLVTFKEVVPLRKVAILYNSLLDEVVPELKKRVLGQADRLGLEAVGVPVGSSVGTALAAIPPDVDGVYVTPLMMLPPSEWDRLVTGLIERKLPSYTMLGRPEVERGVLAGTAPETDVTRFSRRVALMVQRIVLGEDPGKFPVTFSSGERLTLNMETARAIGFSPNWSVLTEAELLNVEREEAEHRWTLATAVREAMDKNLELAAEEHRIAAGRQEIELARSVLLPQVEASTLLSGIDKDRAGASLGAQPQRQWSASATVEQLLYSESARANLAIQKRLQARREAERDTTRLDIGLETAVAYLDVLRAKTFERIQRENLQVIRANLELARVRQSIGSAGPADVYRWESRIASGRKSVITANAQRNVAEIALNQLLHRPAEEGFMTVEADLEDPELITAGGRIFTYRDNPADFKILRGFLVERSMELSPELRSLDAAIAAQERILIAARRAFYSPTAGISIELERVLAEGGAGTGGTSPLPVELPEADRTNFSIGLQLRLPLYEGGARRADRESAEQELLRLRLQRQALEEQIERRVRSTLHVAGASHASIALSQAAADSAHRGLDVVTDAYSRGALPIIDLLDAQNSALVADQGAANAIHDFLIDLMRVERAVGRYTVLMTEEQRAEVFSRLDAVFEKAGRPRKPVVNGEGEPK